MKNSYFDKVVTSWKSGKTIGNTAIANILRNYIVRSDLNISDDRPLFNDVMYSPTSTKDFIEMIDFLHKAGVKKFYFGCNSTACLSLLCSLLSLNNTTCSNKLYTVTVLGSTLISSSNKFSTDLYSVLLISIPESNK